MEESLGKIHHRHKNEFRMLEKDIKKMKKKSKKADFVEEAQRLRDELAAKHEAELAAARGLEGDSTAAEPAAEPTAEPAAGPETTATASSASEKTPPKASRAAKRRAKKEAAAKAREEELERAHAALAAAGGSKREQELTALRAKLSPLGRGIVYVPADGHCMFHALVDQLRSCGASEKEASVPSLRAAAADYIRSHADGFGPFLPYDESDGDFAKDAAAAVEAYCERLRSTKAWGGEPEARALAEALGRPIVVHKAGATAVTFGGEEGVAGGSSGAGGDEEALHITFHERFISSGPHYNSARLGTAEE